MGGHLLLFHALPREAGVTPYQGPVAYVTIELREPV